MPNIKSAIKRMRSNARKTLVNTPVTSSMATAVKKVEKNPTKETLQVAVKRIDKAVANGSSSIGFFIYFYKDLIYNLYRSMIWKRY